MSSSSQPPPDPQSRTQQRLEGNADPATVSQWRRLAQDWLRATVVVSNERFADVTLAVDEAMSNCVDHAYRGRSAGSMVLVLTYDELCAAVRIHVTDEGSWREPSSFSSNAFRGRGVLLMEALADECTVDGQHHGTTVCLVFGDCPPHGAGERRNGALKDTA